MMRSRDHERAFTLAEVIIATMVFAIALLALAAAMATMSSLRQDSRAQVTAIGYVRYALEEVMAVDDFDYVATHVGGFVFTVPELSAPDPKKEFPGGGYPAFAPGEALPPLDPGTVVPPPPAPSGYDPVLDERWDQVGIGLIPATSMSARRSGYGNVHVEQLQANLLHVEVVLSYGTAGGNRRVRGHAYLVRSVDVDTFEF